MITFTYSLFDQKRGGDSTMRFVCENCDNEIVYYMYAPTSCKYCYYDFPDSIGTLPISQASRLDYHRSIVVVDRRTHGDLEPLTRQSLL